MTQDSQTAIIVPARLASTRFPNKLLHKIKGQSLLIHVAERIRSEVPEFPLIFAVDDERLQEELSQGGFESLMTSNTHTSGTDRLAEANSMVGAKYVINIQGDEPLVTADQIRKLATKVQSGATMATLATVFLKPEDFKDPNQVKVVIGKDQNALYFSRAPLPYFRDEDGSPSEDCLAHHLCYLHLGMYAYEAEFLETFAALPPGRLEQLEKLEQLRVLENGYPIAVGMTSDPSVGVDTLEDAERFAALI
jgi:3-deoxy-manno-octulosonate cytidylyltransferase (CMP-KDO synthetase)